LLDAHHSAAMPSGAPETQGIETRRPPTPESSPRSAEQQTGDRRRPRIRLRLPSRNRHRRDISAVANDAITGNSSDNFLTGGIGNDTLTGGSGSDTFIYHVGDGNDTIAGGSGASCTDAISLSDGTSSLGTFGVDWTLSITSGSIVSTDTTNHVIALSQDAVGQIDLSNGATIHFAELERVTW
jgi:hypothetical protein